jgi:hypothetical protein
LLATGEFERHEGITVGKLFSDYRPELHYMRGPGPAWHAKQAGRSAPSAERPYQLSYAIWLLPAVGFVVLGFAAAVALA